MRSRIGQSIASEGARAMLAMKLERLAVLASVVLGLLAAFFAQSARADDKVRLQLHWQHQAQIAGYYMAVSRGFYDREGLEVTLLEGGPDVTPLERLGSGAADLSIGWLAHALAFRERGLDFVNVAQVFQQSGMGIACRRDAGIAGASDVAGQTVGVWNFGDEINLRVWLERWGVDWNTIKTVPQALHGRDLVEGRRNCITVMNYNEYWDIIEAGIKPSDLYIAQFADEGVGLLEDGIYARAERLRDPAFRKIVARFLRASAEGWRYAREHPTETLAVTLAHGSGLHAVHQRRMLDAVLNLIRPPGKSPPPFGLLDLDAYERTVSVLAADPARAQAVRRAAHDAWTLKPWSEAGLGGNQMLTGATRHYLAQATSSQWFYLLDLIGAFAGGLAGFMRAQQRKYDMWGAFILTFVTAVGGGTLRDVLVGGDRHPPFIFVYPVYMYMILAIVIVGTVVAQRSGEAWHHGPRFERTLAVLDTIGLAAFTVVGAKVALVANLHWFWVPICSALTCAGGGMLTDVITGREPRTFLGEPYEEIAVAGGLLLYGGLWVANLFEYSDWVVTTSIVVTLIAVFHVRMLVIRRGLRSLRLGHA